MLAQKDEKPPMTSADHRASFFRQSGWLMIANIAGGVLMWAVHFLSKFLPAGDYSSFGASLAVIILLPTLPLQMVLAQQTAKALANHTEHELSSVIRRFLSGTFLVWVAGAIVVWLLQDAILKSWQMTNPIGLWITMGSVLLSLWMPILCGILQGQQNFLSLGWAMVSTAIGRITIATVAVLAFKAGAVGMMIGVFIGLLAAATISAWHTRSLWLARPQPFDWRGLLAQVSPLALAFLGFQTLFTVDTLFAKAYFPPATADAYVMAGTLSRALMWLVLPLATVMFPRIVHSAAKSEKSDLMGLVLLGTAVLGISGALGLSVLGPWVVRIVGKGAFVPIASAILPWYASAMVPLALANVLLNHLLAKPASKLVLALGVFLLAASYLIALTQIHSSPVAMLRVMGSSNLVLLALCAGFSWRARTLRAATA
jgi:O-antigen/teichoic acid export membrane protein